jgi:hypothetical protein
MTLRDNSQECGDEASHHMRRCNSGPTGHDVFFTDNSSVLEMFSKSDCIDP